MDRQRRLRREWEVRRVRSRGQAFADGPLVLRVLANETDPAANRYTVVAGKKAGGAVQRNRLKRLVREALRHLEPALAPGHDIVVIVRGTVEEMPSYAVAHATVERLVRRAGLQPAGERPAPTAGDTAAAALTPPIGSDGTPANRRATLAPEKA